MLNEPSEKRMIQVEEPIKVVFEIIMNDLSYLLFGDMVTLQNLKLRVDPAYLHKLFQ
jgi:hypothetical protein